MAMLNASSSLRLPCSELKLAETEGLDATVGPFGCCCTAAAARAEAAAAAAAAAGLGAGLLNSRGC